MPDSVEQLTGPESGAAGERAEDAGHGRHALRGAFAYGIRQVIMMGLGAGANLAITRLLLPEDFGRIAVLNLVVSVGKLLAVGGFGVYLVQRKQEVLDSDLAQVVNLQFWVAVAVQALVGLAGLVSLGFDTDHLVWPMLFVMLFAVLFGVLRSGSMIVLERGLEFGQMATVEVAEQVVNTVLMVGLAAAGAHAWSVAIAAVPAAVVSWRLAQRYAAFRFRPSVPRLTAELRAGLTFCAHMFTPYLMGAARVAALPIIVGRIIGLDGVGYCERATFIGSLPFAILSGIQQKVLFSYTARIQSDAAGVRRAVQESVYLSTVLDKILYLPLVAFAPELVRWVFTPRWMPSVPLIEVIAWGCAAVGAFNGIAFPVVSGLGEPKYLGVSNGAMLILTWLLLAPFVHWFGLIGYAYVSLTLWVVTPYLYRVIAARVGAFKIARAVITPFAAFVGAVYSSRWIAAHAAAALPTPVMVVLYSAAGIGLYFVYLAVVDGRRLFSVVVRIGSILHARNAASAA